MEIIRKYTKEDKESVVDGIIELIQLVQQEKVWICPNCGTEVKKND